MIRQLGVLLALSLPAPVPALATQRPALTDVLITDHRLRLQLHDGTWIREAWYAGLSDSLLYLRAILRPRVDRAELDSRVVALDSIARVWRQEGTYWREGAWIGAVLGVVSTASLLIGFAGDDDSPSCSVSCNVLSVAGVGAAGALLGAGAGALFMKWPLRWAP